MTKEYNRAVEIISARNSKQLLERQILSKKRYLIKNAKSRARMFKHEFNITVDDIDIPEICPYLNIPLTITVKGPRQIGNASLDRIDNKKGYIKGNIQIISDLANRVKYTLSVQELITFANNVIKLHR